MPPQQTPYVPPAQQPGHNQYEFIMNPQKPGRPNPLGNKRSLLIVIGVVATVVILFVIVFSLLAGGNSTPKPFVLLARQQQEIIRVAELQYPALTQQNVRNFAINSKLSMQTNQAELLTLLADNGVKISGDEIALGTDTTTDTLLANSLLASTLDTTLTQALQDEIESYQSTLRIAYASTTNNEARELLDQFNNDADLLLAQSKQ